MPLVKRPNQSNSECARSFLGHLLWKETLIAISTIEPLSPAKSGIRALNAPRVLLVAHIERDSIAPLRIVERDPVSGASDLGANRHLKKKSRI